MEQKPKRQRRRDTLEMMLMPAPTNRSGAALYRYVHFKHVIPKCNSETAIITKIPRNTEGRIQTLALRIALTNFEARKADATVK